MSRNVMKKPPSGGLSSSRAPRFSPAFRGRKHSIILDGETPSENVIVNPRLLKQHKKAPRAPGDEQELMSDQGFAWWSDPFMRMLCTPLRQCILTKRYAPRDHLVRITATLFAESGTLVSSSTPAYLMPSDLHHPRYAPRPQGQGVYIPCSKNAVPFLSGKGRHRGVFPGAEVHGLIGEQIVSGLQARCVEEAQLLASRLASATRYKPGEPAAFTVRRLTVAEHELALQQSAIRDSKAVAVIVVPKDGMLEAGAKTPPMSRLLIRGSTPPNRPGLGFGTTLPVPRIPIYWVTAIFQDLQYRVALRKALDSALSAERTALQTARNEPQPQDQGTRSIPYEPKSQDAYAICASQRADSVPLAIAFWRLRLWEGIDCGWF